MANSYRTLLAFLIAPGLGALVLFGAFLPFAANVRAAAELGFAFLIAGYVLELLVVLPLHRLFGRYRTAATSLAAGAIIIGAPCTVLAIWVLLDGYRLFLVAPVVGGMVLIMTFAGSVAGLLFHLIAGPLAPAEAT